MPTAKKTPAKKAAEPTSSESISDRFSELAERASYYAGHYLTFGVMAGIVLLWAVSGPFFGFTQTWQLVINTGTTIITFLMVFLIQNTQNRDSRAVHLKLDELIRAMKTADNRLIRAENQADEELEALKEKYEAIATDTGTRHASPAATKTTTAAAKTSSSATKSTPAKGTRASSRSTATKSRSTQSRGTATKPSKPTSSTNRTKTTSTS